MTDDVLILHHFQWQWDEFCVRFCVTVTHHQVQFVWITEDIIVRLVRCRLMSCHCWKLIVTIKLTLSILERLWTCSKSASYPHLRHSHSQNKRIYVIDTHLPKDNSCETNFENQEQVEFFTLVRLHNCARSTNTTGNNLFLLCFCFIHEPYESFMKISWMMRVRTTQRQVGGTIKRNSRRLFVILEFPRRRNYSWKIFLFEVWQDETVGTELGL